MRTLRCATVGLGVLTLLAPAVSASADTPGSARDAAAAPACTSSALDRFAGAPRYKRSSGAVDIRQRDKPPRVLTRGSIGAGRPVAGAEFGRALAQERTGTGCDVLVIGAPGVAGKGAVYLAVDSADGFHCRVTVTAPAGATGDRFGIRC
jgi:hypothetical protein